MNRNTQAHFAQVPTMDISRSKFDRSFNHTTTANLGELVPCYIDCDIVPGDTVTMKMSDLIRMTTPICPTMGELKADFFFFFIPNRLVWDHFKRFMGENDSAPWVQTTTYTVPQIKINNTAANADNKLMYTVEKGSILDHMGIPTNYSWKLYKSTVTDPDTQESTKREIAISQLPVRAYCLVWNEFFRSESLQNPVNVPKNDNNTILQNTNVATWSTNQDSEIVNNTYRGGYPCLKVCKTFDYFSACLPSAQAGPEVSLPMNGTAPVKFNQAYNTTSQEWEDVENWTGEELKIAESSPGAVITIGKGNEQSVTSFPGYTFNFMADLSQATGATINALRNAFAIQKWQEREARSGQRYIEMVQSHFRTTNPDFRLQRPEYLGGFTHNINVNQVLSQGNDTSGAPIGTTGAYSLSVNTNGDVFSHSFTEHGILLGLFCIRQTHHVFQQGINRMWLKKEKFDFYFPEMANLGEEYVYNMELYAQGTDEDKEAFGYQERWASMRYMPDIISGEMRSDYPTSLDVWHYGDWYTEKPVLGNKWIKETDANLLRTLAIQDQDEFKVDMYFGATYTRPMPVFSVPGLLDHH